MIVSRLPLWAQRIATVLIAVWCVGMVASTIISSFVLADAVGELTRIHARALAVQGCQISLREKTVFWPRRQPDGLCHIEDLMISQGPRP